MDNFPKRELQGPRPTPLKVRKVSHKIRKPPVAPPPAGAQHHHRNLPPPPPPPPVIIYTVSPKIIHTNPNDFMSLVQRLTGPNNPTRSPSVNNPSSSYAFGEEISNYMEAMSPAARFASIERTKSSPDGRRVQVLKQEVQVFEGIEVDSELQRITGQFPGILSPNPNALPPIPPSFFSPPSDNINIININNNINNPLGFFHDLSPVLHSSRNHHSENSFILPSPSSFLSPYGINVPSPNTLDLFNSLFDL